jgi:peptidoglycan/xylan/chitin deacetylase (PgdA/CDA1 family)/GT2 family glycosyltransferase
VVPTFQRRQIVRSAVEALMRLGGPTYEVIVVVDGSTDGTAETLRSLRLPVPFRVLEQANAGASRARNQGAASARGEVLLFLDDDMMAAPDLLSRHEDAYADGADAVLGHIPLAPDAPRSFLSRGLGTWAEQRRERLMAEGAELHHSDLLTGQLSVRREVFQALGGFDEGFTRGGSFGGEDTDFGRRLFDSGYRVVFAPHAVSWQYYAVTPRAYLRQWYQAGEADVAYVRKHPGDLESVASSRRPHSRSNRYVVRPLARLPVVSAIAGAAARSAAVGLAERWPDAPRAERLFFKVRNLEYWRGVNAAGGLPRRRAFRVLCYHSLSDLRGAARIEQYGLPPTRFRRQLRLLRSAGYRFVTMTEAVNAIAGEGGLPRRALLVTFDDCYRDLLTEGLPVLRAEDAPAAAFAVAGRVGGTNSWDVAIGAPELPLLDAEGLLALRRAGVSLGAHGATHRPLVDLEADQLDLETAAAADTLERLGLGPATSFAYPHGAHDAGSRAAVARAGYAAAFTVTPGLVRCPAADPFTVPRIEILRRDGAGLRLILKVAAAGRLPELSLAPRTMRRVARSLSSRGR